MVILLIALVHLVILICRVATWIATIDNRLLLVILHLLILIPLIYVGRLYNLIQIGHILWIINSLRILRNYLLTYNIDIALVINANSVKIILFFFVL